MGLKGTSVNWGWWKTGMANDEKISKYLLMEGYKPMAPESAFNVLGSVLNLNLPQLLVFKADMNIFKSHNQAKIGDLIQGTRVPDQPKARSPTISSKDVSLNIEKLFKEVILICFYFDFDFDYL